MTVEETLKEWEELVIRIDEFLLDSKSNISKEELIIHSVNDFLDTNEELNNLE